MNSETRKPEKEQEAGAEKWNIKAHPERPSDRWTCRFGSAIFVCFERELPHYHAIKEAHNTALISLRERKDAEIEREQGRWQEEIASTLQQLAPAAQIDGSGCDSGDPLDLSLAEIQQAFAHWDNRAFDALNELGLTAKGYSSALEAVIHLFTSDALDPDTEALLQERDSLRERLEKAEEQLRIRSASDDGNHKNLTAAYERIEQLETVLRKARTAMLRHAGWNKNFAPDGKELPMSRPTDVAEAEKLIDAALATAQEKPTT
jgi:hypothetical protein